MNSVDQYTGRLERNLLQPQRPPPGRVLRQLDPPLVVSSEKGNMRNYIKKFLREEHGQDLVEYGLLAAFLSIAAVVVLRAIGPLVSALYVSVLNVLS